MEKLLKNFFTAEHETVEVTIYGDRKPVTACFTTDCKDNTERLSATMEIHLNNKQDAREVVVVKDIPLAAKAIANPTIIPAIVDSLPGCIALLPHLHHGREAPLFHALFHPSLTASQHDPT